MPSQEDYCCKCGIKLDSKKGVLGSTDYDTGYHYCLKCCPKEVFFGRV